MPDDGPQGAGAEVWPSKAVAAGLIVRSSVASQPGRRGRTSEAAAAGLVVPPTSPSIMASVTVAAPGRGRWAAGAGLAEPQQQVC
jgi:hypothetical protein